MAKIYVSSDHHFGHAKLVNHSDKSANFYHSFRARPFETVGEMNDQMVERHNKVVSPNDIYYDLGDVWMGKPKAFEACVRNLNGTKIVVRGNHDPTKTRCIELGFDFSCDEYYLIHDGLVIWLAHIPVNNASDKRVDVSPRPEPRMPYNIALCGHVHTAWKIGPNKEINVGVDQWDFAPVSLDEIVQFAKENDLVHALR